MNKSNENSNIGQHSNGELKHSWKLKSQYILKQQTQKVKKR